MRIPGTKVWRAFPELDRFDDDQCARFVRGARRSRSLATRLLLGLMMLGVTALVGAGVAIGCFGVVVWAGLNHFGPYDWRGDVRDIVIVITAGGAGLISGLLLRDRLLRKRIAWVIAHRGSCMQCRYVLLGLPVDAQLNVICPECGVPTPVDASLGELSTDERGIGRFTPRQDSVVKPWLTPAQWGRVGKWAVGLAIAALIIGGSWWGWGELQIRRQAELARSERNGADVIQQLVAASQLPGASPTGPNAMDLLGKVLTELDTVERTVARSPMGSALANKGEFPEYALVGRPLPDATINYDPTVGRDLALMVLDALPGSGVIEAMDRMVQARFADDTGEIVQAAPLGQSSYQRLGYARRIARLNVGRMNMAWVARNLTEFESALRANLAIARMLRQQPIVLHGLTADAIETVTYGSLRRILLEHPPVEWLDAIDRVRADERAPAGWRERALKGEREITLDYVRSVFADVSVARRGEWPAQSYSGNPESGPFGSYAENRDAVIAWYDHHIAECGQRRFERTGVPRAFSDADLAIVQLLESSFGYTADGHDRLAIEHDGLSLMIALERYRLEHTRYPAHLADLVPSVLPQVPIDSWTGLAFRYRTLKPADDPFAREYLLYSVGSDGQDDGGVSAEIDPRWRGPSPQTSAGFDFVINHPER